MIKDDELRARLDTILRASPLFQVIFDRADQVLLKNWYVAGGCVTQTIWNALLNLEPLYGLRDVDLVYFDPEGSEAEEMENRARVKALFADLPLPIDVINEARVHEWYPKKYGYAIPPYESTEDGIGTWLPAFSIGMRSERSDLKVAAPFGLEDVFGMIVRPNKRQINEEIYCRMVVRLQRDWPSIQIVPWNYG